MKKTFLLVCGLFASLLGLEARALDFTVDRTDDTASATACTSAANDCSLRGAVIAANAAAGDDVITLPAGTYALTVTGLDEDAASTGDLDITGNLTINGAGAKTTIIDGNGTDRVLHVDPLFTGGGNVTVSLSSLTVQNGHPTGSTTDGGGILNQGKLTLTDCAVKNNSTGTNGDGGGIYDDGGPTVTCVNSTFSGNSARDGGALANSNTAIFTNCTISGNVATDAGGGISNTANPPKTLTIVNSTIANNSAPASMGGGVLNADGNGAVTLLKNTILFDNTGGNCDGTITSQGNNLDSANNCGLSGTGDIINTDPLLGSLADNGGPTLTHNLLAGSPAIDKGTDVGAPSTDQRGISRPLDGDSDGTAAFDIGAVEFNRCGDGAVADGEECDDGNTASGDGCSDTCATESGSTTGGNGSGGCSLIRS